MCTVVILRRPGHAWPLVLAANRDEMTGRPWLPPGRHWPDRPETVAGQDQLSGGSWLGVNDHGVVAAVLNRTGSLGPQAGKRSRGELVLEALDHADAREAAEALGEIDPHAYRSFNLVIADDREAYWLSARNGALSVELHPVPEGTSIITSQDMNEPNAPRTRTFLPKFRQAPAPEPDSGDWAAWEALMATCQEDAPPPFDDTMCIVTDRGYGTVSSSLIALPRHAPGARTIWRFAAGRPDITPFETILPEKPE
ncbi:MAG: NRDE family protein [Alphaproteobacteria bacterium]